MRVRLFRKKHLTYPARRVSALAMALVFFALAGCNLQGTPDGHPDVVFIGWDDNNLNQIFHNVDGEMPEQLTDSPDGVYDYALAPDSRHFAFSTVNDNGSSAIWRKDFSNDQPVKVLDCPNLVCHQPVWASDGQRLIYERAEIRPDGTTGSPYLWWLNVETRETRPVFEDSDARGTAAQFSPDGNWLSYSSPEDEGVYIYNFDDGRSQFFPNEVGMPAVWSPNSEKIVVPNLDLVILHGDEGEDHLQHTHDYQTATHLFVGDTATGELQSISGDLGMEDGAAAWSPDGNWIAFGRRPARTAAGRQLWLVRPDGSDAHPLTKDPDINYGPPIWSPDGRYLLFQRISLTEPQSDPGIWVFDLKTGQQIELAASGIQPQWLVQRPY